VLRNGRAAGLWGLRIQSSPIPLWSREIAKGCLLEPMRCSAEVGVQTASIATYAPGDQSSDCWKGAGKPSSRFA